MEEEPLDSRGRNITLAIFGLIVVVIAALVINNYRTKAGWISAMKGSDPEARKAAARAMMRKGQVAEQLQGDRPSIRSAAVRALALIGDTAAAEQLIQFFKDPDAPVKDQANQALVKLGHEIVMKPVVKSLGDSDESIRNQCDSVLRAFHEIPIPDVAPKLVDADARATAATCLTEIGKQNPENAKKVLAAIYPYLDSSTQGVDEVVQVRVVQIIDGIPDPAPGTAESSVPPLIRMLGPRQTQRAAVGALQRKADKLATLPLLPVLKNELIRSETVVALGAVADARAVPELVKLLGSFSDDLRTKTAEAMRRIGPPAVPALLVAAKSSDAYTRASAVSALGGIKHPTLKAAHPTAQAAAVAALKDPDVGVRVAAATSLQVWPSPSCIPALVAAFDDPDGRVADSAAEAINAIVGVPGGNVAIPRLVAALDTATNPARAYYATRAFRLIGGRTAVPPLVKALQHPNAHIATSAARLLGDLGNQEALGPLQALASSTQNDEVRWAAERSARRLGGEETS